MNQLPKDKAVWSTRTDSESSSIVNSSEKYAPQSLLSWVQKLPKLVSAEQEVIPTHTLVFILCVTGIGLHTPVAKAHLQASLKGCLGKGSAPAVIPLRSQIFDGNDGTIRLRDDGSQVILNPEDREQFELWRKSHFQSQRISTPPIESLTKDGILYDGSRASLKSYQWGEEKNASTYFKTGKNGECFPRLQVEGSDSTPVFRALEFQNQYFYYQQQKKLIGSLTFSHPLPAIRHFLSAPHFSREHLPTAIQLINSQFSDAQPMLPPAPAEMRIGRNPRPILYLKPTPYYAKTHIQRSFRSSRRFENLPISAIELRFDYDGIVVKDSVRPKRDIICRHPVTDEEVELQRSFSEEKIYRERLVNRGFTRLRDCLGLQWKASDTDSHCYGFYSYMSLDESSLWADFFENELPYFETLGWIVEIDIDFPFRLTEATSWYYNLSEESKGYMDCEVGVEINGERVSLIPVLHQLLALKIQEGASSKEGKNANESYTVQLQGKQVLLPKKRVDEILLALESLQGEENSDTLKVSRTKAQLILDITNGGEIDWQVPKGLKSLEATKKAFLQKDSQKLPRGFKAELRDYQQTGLQWLRFLRKIECGGILADDMGLGKTIQTIAFILKLKQSRQLKEPVLILCPSSVATNWKRELASFAPSLKTLLLTGPDRKEYFDTLDEYQVIISSYPLVRRDKDILRKKRYSLLVCDEAQYLKNPEAITTGLITQLHTAQTLHLTGTPIENNLRELWSLFNVMEPGYLGSRTRFARLYQKPIERGDAVALKALQQKIKPFILRRVKSEVLKELPEKNSIAVRLEMTKRQKQYYETVRASVDKKVRDLLKTKGAKGSQIEFLTALLRLRQACCHPALSQPKGNWKLTDSVKLSYLKDQIPELRAANHKILVFSQFTTMLDHIGKMLTKEKIEYSLLTGKTKNRDKEIETFQSGKTDVFLISLKAGGVGLNLTAADTVLLCDPWWNPAVESQAIDRAHRIGQRNAVTVFRLYTIGTIEERIEELQASKRKLFENTLEGTGAGLGSKFRDEEMEFLLAS